ncbi:MAG TPA: hypothetical protein VED40_03835 [Azospirillaceae bacterium]|nr:hypothetical protein [Azospirillaceae bacterium]
MSVHESFLVYRGFRFLKAAAALAGIAILAYLVYNPMGPHNGGTWLGYTLGTIGAGLIGWLTWLGVRKRQYSLGATKLQSWVSAHVYLGLSLLIVGTLHTGFQFGWNVHTLAYALMVGVILSGVFGIYAYSRYPALMTANRGGQTLDFMLRQLAELDRQAREIALTLGDEFAAAVRSSEENTRIGGGAWAQLRASGSGCATLAATRRVEELARGTTPELADSAGRLLALLGRKCDLLARIRKEVQFRALMEVWLYVHVPMTVALVVVLAIHIIAVFFYW